MGWATSHVAKLKAGETVQFRPRGHSMAGRIDDGQLVTVAPVEDHGTLRDGDIVLCTVRGSQLLHLVKGRRGTSQFLIGNNRGHTNGWTDAAKVYGKVVAVA